MKIQKEYNATAHGQTNRLNVAYDVYAPTVQEALLMLRNQLLAAAMSIQDLPLGTTWDQISKEKGPIGLSRAGQFITSRELAWEDVRQTVGAMSAAGKFDKMLPTVPQRQLLVDLLAGACKHVSPTYRAE